MKPVLFDATTLVDGNDMIEERRGIYFIAKKLLMEFQSKADCDLILFAKDFKVAGLCKVRDDLGLSAKLYREPNVCDRSLHKVITFFRRKRMDVFSRPLARKYFSLWITFLYVVSNLYYFVFNSFFKFSKDMVFFSPRTSAPKYLDKAIKRFIVLHDLIPYSLPEYSSQRKLGWFGYLIKTLNKENYYFAISEYTKKDFCNFSKKIDPSHVTVTPWAAADNFRSVYDKVQIDGVRKKYGIPEGKKFLFSLCTLEPRKNLLRIIRTFFTFIQKNNIEDLVFVVGGGEWENFQKIIKKEIQDDALVSKNLLHIGYVDDDDLPVLFSGAEWFVYTSCYEGFGLPPLEAMQCGCAVITSNCTSLPEVVGDAGITIDWDSDEQHIAAYEKYFFDDGLRSECVRKGIERAKLFSWNKTVEKMLNEMRKEG